MVGTVGALDPEVERLLEGAARRRSVTLRDRELVAQAVAAFGFLLAALSLAMLGDAGGVDVPVLVVLVASLVAAGRVEFAVGAGYAVPTQVVFVPMLFLLPPAIVPVVVAATALLERAPDYLRGRKPPMRALSHLGDSWFAVGPALVFAAGGVDGLDWMQWPLWLAAFAAQVGMDLGASLLRERFALGVRPRLQLSLLANVWAVDGLLSCVGLLAAVAAMEQRFAFLLVLPLLALMELFARERRNGIDQALELSRAYRGTALLLGDVIGDDDEYTGLHSQGVVALSISIATELQLSARDAHLVEFGALLHDVGKIRIPKEIINKPGKLDDDEWAVMKTHTIIGQEMLEIVGGSLADVGVVVRGSHERWDGRGYPDGLAGVEIPLPARIVACADTYSAMTTDRSYRPARSHEEAMAELERCAGTQFDPEVVAAALRVLGRELRGPSVLVEAAVT